MRIYFDENFSTHLTAGFDAFQKGRRSEGIEVFHITNDFPKGCPDETWIPGVAQKHACVITQDQNIYRREHQWELCREYQVGFFFFDQPKKKTYTYWAWIQEVFRRWDEIKHLATTRPRPFGIIYEPHRRKFAELGSKGVGAHKRHKRHKKGVGHKI